MEQSELEEILARGAATGEAEFSVDFFKAARLLAHKALPEPGFYLLKLFQAAVARGASRLNLEAGGNRLVLTWNGPPLTYGEMEELSRHLLATDPARRDLHHLAIGLNTLYSLHPHEVTLRSSAMEYHVEIDRSRLSDTPPALEGWETNRLEILRSPEGLRHQRVWRRLKEGDLGGAATEARGLTSLELDTLGTRCRWAPIPIVFNDVPLNNPHWHPCPGADEDWTGSVNFKACPPGHRVEAFLYLDKVSPGVIALPPELTSARHRTLLLREGLEKASLEHDGREGAAPLAGLRFAGKPALAGFAALARTGESYSRLAFVVDGVEVAEERNLLDRPGQIGVVSGLGLTTDLSEFGIVHDGAFQRTMELLREQVRWVDSQG